jgi:hypothetical protein
MVFGNYQTKKLGNILCVFKREERFWVKGKGTVNDDIAKEGIGQHN